MITPAKAVRYALQNFYTPVLNLTINGSGGSAQGEQYFEQPYLVRRFRTSYYPVTITPSDTTYTPAVAGDQPIWNQVLPSKENYSFSMSTEQNGYTYIGAGASAPVDVLNDSDCLWWLIPFATKIRINVQHTATLNPAVDTFPVIHKFQWIGYRLTDEIANDENLLFEIINTLKL